MPEPQATPTRPPAPTAADPSAVQQLIGLRRALLAHASRQVGEPSAAQDLVQDTLEAALRGLHSFEGRSSLSTWAFAILRHRIADHHRRPRMLVPLSAVMDDDGEGASDEALDHLIGNGRPWPADAAATRAQGGHGDPVAPGAPEAMTPEDLLAQRQFWAQVERGVASLSATQARVFRLRDLLDQDATHVSDALGISPNHCHVVLHRARARLRAYLQGDASFHGLKHGIGERGDSRLGVDAPQLSHSRQYPTT